MKRSWQIMNSQDDTSSRSLDINQLQWALRHGQKIEGLENMVLTRQSDAPVDNHNPNDDVGDQNYVHNTVLKEQIDKLGQSLNREIVSLKGEFAIIAEGTALEEKIDQLGQSLNQEILSLKSELIDLVQGEAMEKRINQLEQSLTQEFVSLKNEIAIVTEGGDSEEENQWENILKDHDSTCRQIYGT